MVADVLTWHPGREYDAWHDRTVFHFLTEPAQRAAYVETAARCVAPGGVAVLGVFAEDDPTRGLTASLRPRVRRSGTR